LNNREIIRKKFGKLTEKLGELDLTKEDLDEIRRHAKGLIASAEVRKNRLKQVAKER